MAGSKEQGVFSVAKKSATTEEGKKMYSQLRTRFPIRLSVLQEEITKYFILESRITPGEKETFFNLFQTGYNMTDTLLTQGGAITALGKFAPLQEVELKSKQIKKDLSEKIVLRDASGWSAERIKKEITIPENISLGNYEKIMLVAPNAVKHMTYVERERFKSSVHHIFTGDISSVDNDQIELSNAICNIFTKLQNDANILPYIQPETLCLVSVAEILRTKGRGVVPLPHSKRRA